MRRLIIPFAAAALVAACYDAPAAPSSSLRPASALFDGDPPPPPVSGDGFADFTASEATDNSGSECQASALFKFDYDYFNNPQEDGNAYLHMRIDGNGLDIAVHQTEKKITAKGTLTQPDFSFRIDEVLAGTITNKESVPETVRLSLSGQLTLTDGTTCAATATLSATLKPVTTTPPGDVPPVP